MVTIKKLNCGTTVIMEKSERVQSAALGIWVRAGASDEWDEVSGVSHFIEHMMFKGTKNRTAKQIAEDVDKIGGVFNAFTGKEATCYYIKTLSSNICRGAEILLDMLTGSKFDQEEMDRERHVICEEIKMVKDTPDDDVYDTISELVAGGNFDEEAIEAIFEDRLTSLRDKKPKKEIQLKPYQQSFNVKVRDIEQTHICLATPGIALDDPRYYAFVLLNSIFGGSMSSRLFQNIREQKGLAYSVCSMNLFSSYWGFFSIYAGVSPEKAEEALDAIHYELDTLRESGVTEEELAMAKEQMKSSYIFGLESVNSRMFSIGKNKLLLDRVYAEEEVLSSFDRVTREDIREVAEMIGDYSSYCGAAVTGRDFDLERIVKHGN